MNQPYRAGGVLRPLGPRAHAKITGQAKSTPDIHSPKSHGN